MRVERFAEMTPKRRIIPVFVPHLGCPNACVFCNQRRISGVSAPATAETVVQAIQAAQAVLPAGTAAELAFYGGSFTAIPAQEQEALLAAAAPFIHSGALSGIRISTRPDAITQPILDRLRRAQVQTIELGSQSMLDAVLQQSGRGHTAQDTVNAAGQIRENGFRLILQMMTGLPGDSPDGAMETARRMIALQPDGVRIYPTVIIRDTPLYEQWKAGRYREHTVAEAVELCARLLSMFDAARIPVIRLGLNPTDALSGGDAVAGAYHPAFGELVSSRILLEQARQLLTGIPAGSRILLGVHRRQVSAMVGQHRCNLTALQSEFALQSVKVCAAPVEIGKIRIQNIAKR